MFLKTCAYVYFKDISLKHLVLFYFSFVFGCTPQGMQNLKFFTQGPNPSVEAES